MRAGRLNPLIAQLVASSKDGDSAAMELLIERYQSRVADSVFTSMLRSMNLWKKGMFPGDYSLDRGGASRPCHRPVAVLEKALRHLSASMTAIAEVAWGVLCDADIETGHVGKWRR